MKLFKWITTPLKCLLWNGPYRRYSMVWCFLLTLMGCSKDQPEDVLPVSPQFFLNGRIGTDTLSLQAGVDNVYLYTRFTDTAEPEWQGVFSTCSSQDCSGTLRIVILPGSGNNNSADNSILGHSLFATDSGSSAPSGIGRRYHFVANTAADGTRLTWRKNAMHQWDQAPSDIYYFTANTNPFILSLSATTAMGWSSKVSQQINPDTLSLCGGVNLIAEVALDTVVLSNNFINSAAYSMYSWIGPGANFGTDQQRWPYIKQGIYTMNAVNSTGNCQVEASLSNLPGPGIYQTIDFSVSAQALNATTMNRVYIQWIAPGGQVYSSRLNEQPFGTYFEVIEQKEYQRNENGDRTQLLKVKLNCRLYTDTQGSYPTEIPFQAEGVIAVAVPE
jgi:hypothetical protein